MGKKEARNWYWWLWLSPVVTIPTLVILYLFDWSYEISSLICPSRSCISLVRNTIPILFLILFSGFWHLILLKPALNKENDFVRWHGRQALFLAGIRTLVPILFVLNSGDEEGVLYAVPVLIIVWLVGNIWGQRQAARGKCSFMVWFGQGFQQHQPNFETESIPSGIENIESLIEIIRFSQKPQERQAALNTLKNLGLVEYFDGTLARGQTEPTLPKTRSKVGFWIVGAITFVTLLCIVVTTFNAVDESMALATQQVRQTAKVLPATAMAQTARSEVKKTLSAIDESKATRQVRQTATDGAAAAMPETVWAEVEEAKNWPVVLFDSFSSDDMGWMTGYREDEAAKSYIAIFDGTYRFNTSATQGFELWDYPVMDSVSDFYLTVDARETRGTIGTTYGLIFRKNESNLYAFRINGYNRAQVDLHYFNRWQSLIDQRWETIKREAEFNKLSVLAKGQHFYFFVNDEFIGDITNEQLSNGRVGVIIGSTKSVNRFLCEFDNFELRVP